ncbi:MAG TPA: hypothetical protein VMT53_04760 [Terriglobales bacterium]|nr:hypothetical protein [Terriglobales bacterium]
MARGWESKSVEAQQAEASESRSPKRPPLSAEQKTKLQKREGLLLDRRRVLHQMEGASNERYRSMLERALADLDGKIADLG